jgi:heme exporter protein D
VIFLGFIIPIIALVFESYPRIINRKFGVDIWTHLLYLKDYRKQKGIPKKITAPFIIEGEYDYPPGFIWIVSKFPDKIIKKYEFLFSPFFDSLHLIVIFCISFLITHSLFISLLTQFFYILTPIIVLENSSATPRSLGYTLFTITMVSQFFYSQSGGGYLLIFSIITGSFIFLSHRFTTQGFLFFSLFFSVYLKQPIFMVVFLLAGMLAVILSRGFYITVLKGHLGNLYFWYKNIQYRFAHQIKGDYKEHKTQDFVFIIYNYFLKFPPFVLQITNPWIFPLIYFLVVSKSDYFIHQFIGWVVFSYVLAVITIWVPKMRFLGEGQRYLELSAFPAAFLSSIVFTNIIHTSYAWIGYAYMVSVSVAAFITIVVIQRKAILKDTMRTLNPHIQHMFSYLKHLKRKPRLLCIPHQITGSTLYHTDCPVFTNASYKTIQQISDVYPYLKKPVKEIMKKYKLDAILLDENYATTKDLRIKKFKILKRFGNYVLIKLTA